MSAHFGRVFRDVQAFCLQLGVICAMSMRREVSLPPSFPQERSQHGAAAEAFNAEQAERYDSPCFGAFLAANVSNCGVSTLI
jgi:hypothetical protein